MVNKQSYIYIDSSVLYAFGVFTHPAQAAVYFRTPGITLDIRYRLKTTDHELKAAAFRTE